MIEIRLQSLSTQRAEIEPDQIGRHGPVKVDLVLQPAHLTLPQRAELGELEVLPDSKVRFNTSSGQPLEIGAECDHPALEVLGFLLEQHQELFPDLTPFEGANQTPCARITITDTGESLNRKFTGDYDVDFHPQAVASTEGYTKNLSGAGFRLVDHPREIVSTKIGFMKLVATSIQGLLWTLRDNRPSGSGQGPT